MHYLTIEILNLLKILGFFIVTPVTSYYVTGLINGPNVYYYRCGHHFLNGFFYLFPKKC